MILTVFLSACKSACLDSRDARPAAAGAPPCDLSRLTVEKYDPPHRYHARRRRASPHGDDSSQHSRSLDGSVQSTASRRRSPPAITTSAAAAGRRCDARRRNLRHWCRTAAFPDRAGPDGTRRRRVGGPCPGGV